MPECDRSFTLQYQLKNIANTKTVYSIMEVCLCCVSCLQETVCRIVLKDILGM